VRKVVIDLIPTVFNTTIASEEAIARLGRETIGNLLNDPNPENQELTRKHLEDLQLPEVSINELARLVSKPPSQIWNQASVLMYAIPLGFVWSYLRFRRKSKLFSSFFSFFLSLFSCCSFFVS
jgi:hypothetical protein